MLVSTTFAAPRQSISNATFNPYFYISMKVAEKVDVTSRVIFFFFSFWLGGGVRGAHQWASAILYCTVEMARWKYTTLGAYVFYSLTLSDRCCQPIVLCLAFYQLFLQYATRFQPTAVLRAFSDWQVHNYRLRGWQCGRDSTSSIRSHAAFFFFHMPSFPLCMRYCQSSST